MLDICVQSPGDVLFKLANWSDVSFVKAVSACVSSHLVHLNTRSSFPALYKDPSAPLNVSSLTSRDHTCHMSHLQAKLPQANERGDQEVSLKLYPGVS